MQNVGNSEWPNHFNESITLGHEKGRNNCSRKRGILVASCYEQTRYVRYLEDNWKNLNVDWGIISLNRYDIGTVAM